MYSLCYSMIVTHKNTHTLSRTTLVGFLRISVSGLASDFLVESAGRTENRSKRSMFCLLVVSWMEQPTTM